MTKADRYWKWIMDLNEASNERVDVFSAHLRLAKLEHIITNEDIARQFDTSLDTLDKWIAGQNVPYPAIRDQVFVYLIDRISAQSKE